IEAIKTKNNSRPRIILMCPQGVTSTQSKAEELAKADHLIFISGHYEGYDERIREYLVTDEISIGDYILTGGGLGAMVVSDSVIRLLPNVRGKVEAAAKDSLSTALVGHPQYTRRAIYIGMEVPEVLLSGNHAVIEEWRKQEALKRTLNRRPDLLDDYQLTK